jgi:signal transduction histidine kinase
MAAASVLLVCWAVPVAIHDGLTWQGFLHEAFGFSVVLVATMPILGAFLVTRHPGNRLGWVFCLYGPLRGIEVLADVWVRHDYVRAPGSWPGGPVATWLLFAGPFFLLPLTPLLTLWFPDGRAPTGWWKRVELAPVLAVVFLAGVLLFSWPYRGRRLLPDPPLIHGWQAAIIVGCQVAAVVAVVAGFVAGFASLISRLRRAEPAVRAQVKWFLFGVGAAFVLNVVGDFGDALAPLRLAAVVVLELFIVVAIERYRLWEIDRLINRTVVYGTLTIAAGTVYASAAISIGLVVGGAGAASPLAVAGATLLIAVLFAPGRRRIQLAVDRRFDRRTFDAVTRVRGFTDRLGHDPPDPAELQALLADVLRDPDLVVCFASSDDRFIDASGADTAPPLANEARGVTVVGRVDEPTGIVGYRRSLHDDGPLLTDVLRVAGPSFEYARLQAELRVQLVAIQRSRLRLIEATDAERRRIERDLHDGAQQRLVALALRVRTEQHRHVVEPGTGVDRLLSTTVDELQAAVDDLRAMTHGMLPPVLISGGTGPALRELVGRYDGKVRLLAVPDHRHASTVEATAWFVAGEGLANATKHAVDANVTLSAACGAGSLRVVVSDDGPGGATLAGSGLRGLADRVDACGGKLSLDSRPGVGTDLIAVLPCE